MSLISSTYTQIAFKNWGFEFCECAKHVARSRMKTLNKIECYARNMVIYLLSERP